MPPGAARNHNAAGQPSEDAVTISSEGEETEELAQRSVPRNVAREVVIDLTTDQDDARMPKTSEPVVKD